MKIYPIAMLELQRLFKSPLAWLCLAVVQLLMAMLFFLLIHQFMQSGAVQARYGVTQFISIGLLRIMGDVMIMLSPLLSMRIFSEEFRSGTINLLFSSPVSIPEIVLGKYLGLLCFYFILIGMLISMPLSLSMGTDFDGGLLLSGLIGISLLAAAAAAIGLLISSLTRHPAIAAITTLGVLVLLWMIHIAGLVGNNAIAQVLVYLSMARHFNNLLEGIVSSVDVIYFLLVIVLSISLTIWRLDARRLYA